MWEDFYVGLVNIWGLLSDSSGESDKDLYYSLTFLDFICDYRRDGDDDDF
jgi:hypothetical protein